MAAFPDTGKIWMNGSLVNWADARIHVASHVVHYGSGVFEGARCYETANGPACFRLDAHIRRLIDSARIYRMDPPYSQQQITDAVVNLIQVNKFKACYIRPIIYRGYSQLGVDPSPCPVDVAVMLWEWGAYFTKDAIEQGLDVKVSTWARIAPNTMPGMAKSVANYANSQLIKMEAVAEGYAEGIALDTQGNLSEGSGQNVFIVRDGIIHTPPVGSSILAGITRDSVIRIARDLGYEVREQVLPREMLYIADEVFFVGTAVEVTPIKSVDRRTVGSGRRGPVTEAIQQRFFQIVRGEASDVHGWLQYVNPRETATSGAPIRR
jgi:branched-chain amino acid aminotransferase